MPVGFSNFTSIYLFLDSVFHNILNLFYVMFVLTYTPSAIKDDHMRTLPEGLSDNVSTDL